MNDDVEDAKRKIKDDQERARKEEQQVPAVEPPKTVIEMRRQLEAPISGYGKLIGFSEQYVVVSRITAQCTGNVRCACDAVPDEHTRPCGYSVDIKHNPPAPVMISVFDTGNGKSLICPRCKGIDYEVNMERRIARLFVLDDIDNPNANARQQVIVYDDMVENLTPGESVQVEGEIFVERKAGSSKSSKMDNVLHANSIKYLKKKDVVITDDGRVSTDGRNCHKRNTPRNLNCKFNTKDGLKIINVKNVQDMLKE